MRAKIVAALCILGCGMSLYAASAQETINDTAEETAAENNDGNLFTVKGTVKRLSEKEGILQIDDMTILITPDDYEYLDVQIGDIIEVIAERTTKGLIFYDFEVYTDEESAVPSSEETAPATNTEESIDDEEDFESDSETF